MSWANRDCWDVSMVDDGVVHQSPVGEEYVKWLVSVVNVVILVARVEMRVLA